MIKRGSGLWILLAACVAFLVLNRHAYEGYFQDDELDNISWTPTLSPAFIGAALLTPKLAADNFRPVGHFYFYALARTAHLNFPPYVAVLQALHLCNMVLIFLIAGRLGLKPWAAGLAAAVFGLGAAGFDAYWKPMYVFDVLCTAFCLLSLLAYMHRRWILSFLALWLAYKSKELAVMLPAIFLCYEYLFGSRKWWRVTPFLLLSLSFGLQGVLGNLHRDNGYTFRFTLAALKSTIPFYFSRTLLLHWGVSVLLAVALFTRDRRATFGTVFTLLMFFPLLFLPGRIYPAYVYLPSAGAALAVGALLSLLSPVSAALIALALIPLNAKEFRRNQRNTLNLDHDIRAYVTAIVDYAAAYPQPPPPVVFAGAIPGFEHWGVAAALNIAWHRHDLTSHWHADPDARHLRATEPVLFLNWANHHLDIRQLTAR